MATCYRHPSRETGVSCSSCGRPICPDCMTPTSVGMRCPECARQRTKTRTAANIRVGGGRLNVTIGLIVVNVIVFLSEGGGVLTFGSSSPNTQVVTKGWLDGPDIALNHQYWRLVTSGFLHESILHIGFNMYLLWVLGQMLEPALGSIRFATGYFVSLLAGSAGALFLSPLSPTIGASGAIFGLMGMAFVELRARGVDPFQVGIGGLIVLNLALSLLIPGVSIGGHVGGLIGGALVGLAFTQADRGRIPLVGAYALSALIAVVAVAAALFAAHQGSNLFAPHGTF